MIACYEGAAECVFRTLMVVVWVAAGDWHLRHKVEHEQA